MTGSLTRSTNSLSPATAMGRASAQGSAVVLEGVKYSLTMMTEQIETGVQGKTEEEAGEVEEDSEEEDSEEEEEEEDSLGEEEEEETVLEETVQMAMRSSS